MEASHGKEEKRQESGKEKEKEESSKKEREKEVVEKIRKKSGQEKDRPSSGSRLLSGGLFLGRFFCGFFQRLPFSFLFCFFPFFLFLCRFLAFSLLCHGWPPSRVMKQRTRPWGAGYSSSGDCLGELNSFPALPIRPKLQALSPN